MRVNPVVGAWAAAALATTSLGQETVDQIELLDIGSVDDVGEVTSIVPQGDGVRVGGTAEAMMGFGNLVLQDTLGEGSGTSLAGDDAFGLEVTNLSGTINNARVFIKTGDDFATLEGPVVDLPQGTTETLSVDLTTAGPEFDLTDVRTYGISIFTDAAGGSQELLVEPIGSPPTNLGVIAGFPQSELLELDNIPDGDPFLSALAVDVSPAGDGVNLSVENLPIDPDPQDDLDPFLAVSRVFPEDMPGDISDGDSYVFAFTNNGSAEIVAQSFIKQTDTFVDTRSPSVAIPPGNTRVTVLPIEPPVSFFANDVRESGFKFFDEGGAGGIDVRVEPVTDFGPAQCSFADIAAPLGELTAADLEAFVQDIETASSQPCPLPFTPNQSQLLLLDTAPEGFPDSEIEANVPVGDDGVEIMADNNPPDGDDLGFVATLAPFMPPLDLSGRPAFELDLQLVEGFSWNGKMFIITDPTPADPENGDATFIESDLVEHVRPTPNPDERFRYTIPLDGVPNSDSVVSFGFQLFSPGPGAGDPRYERFLTFRLRQPPQEPCDPVDDARPFGVLNAFDLLERLRLFDQGCP